MKTVAATASIEDAVLIEPVEPGWVIHEAPALRVVPQDLWELVEARQAEMATDTRPDARGDRPFWTQQRPRFIVSGIAKCGCCGASYVKISQNLFG